MARFFCGPFKTARFTNSVPAHYCHFDQDAYLHITRLTLPSCGCGPLSSVLSRSKGDEPKRKSSGQFEREASAYWSAKGVYIVLQQLLCSVRQHCALGNGSQVHQRVF